MGVTQTTEYKKNTLSPLWDETKIFTFENLRKEELEQAIIRFDVFDKYWVFTDGLMGRCELD